MAESNPSDKSEALEVPAELRAALAKFPKERIFVPPSVDAAVLSQARLRLGRLNRVGTAWYPLARWAALAAVIAWVAALTYFFTQSALRPHNRPVFARQDINHDGRVDILDALVLAQKVEQKAILNRQWDLNGDGLIDQRDANLIAADAVRLNSGGHS